MRKNSLITCSSPSLLRCISPRCNHTIVQRGKHMSFSELVVAPALCLPFILSSSVHLTDHVHICDCLSLHPAVSVLACLSEHFIILFSVRVCSSTRFVSLLLCFAFFIFSFFFKCWPVSMLLFYSSPSSFLSLHYLLHLSSCPFQFLSPCPPIC